MLNFQAKYEWTDEQIIDFLLKLQPNDFKKHFPSNKVNDLAGHVLICADQYVVKWCEHNNVKADRWNRGTVEISAKIAIATIPNGSIAGTVSFHSEW